MMAQGAGFFRLAGVARVCGVLLLSVAVSAGSGVAQMAKPNPEAYDTPPVLMHQDAATSVHQEIAQPGTEAQQKNEPGVALLQLNVDVHGFPSHVMVIHGAGMALDEKTVEVVRRDRFKPAMKDGKPVLATIYLKVTFDSAAN
jgi:outer membrane biosynthesis protein TonB